jgi:hypothetical protein
MVPAHWRFEFMTLKGSFSANFFQGSSLGKIVCYCCSVENIFKESLPVDCVDDSLK